LNSSAIGTEACKSDEGLYTMKEISGDKPLSKKDKLAYLAYNFVRGIAGYGCWMRSKYWHPKNDVGYTGCYTGYRYPQT